jgi:death-on-curing protein
MIILSTREILEMHEILINATGGSHGIRDLGLLESAVYGCYQSFGGVDLYPTVHEKAAGLAYAISKNHAFLTVISAFL